MFLNNYKASLIKLIISLSQVPSTSPSVTAIILTKHWQPFICFSLYIHDILQNELEQDNTYSDI